VEGMARVAVLVSTKELQNSGEERQEVRKDAEADPDWVLRTPWREMKLPKPSDETIKRDR